MRATLFVSLFCVETLRCRNRPVSPSHWRVRSVPLRIQPDCDKPLLSKQNLHSKVQVCEVRYFVFIIPGIGCESERPFPKDLFPSSQRSRVRGLQPVDQPVDQQLVQQRVQLTEKVN